MPIYEYACRSCEHSFETMQKASDEPMRVCPQCGEPSLKKLLSAPVFRLKGGGWYETDFKSGGKKNLAGDKAGESAGNGGSDGSGDGGSDAPKKAASADGGASTASTASTVSDGAANG